MKSTTTSLSSDLSLIATLNELQMNRDIVQHAQILLKGSEAKDEGLNVFESTESSMLLGIRIWLMAYLNLNKDNLVEDSRKKIIKMLGAIKHLEKMSFGKWGDWSDPKEFVNMQGEHEQLLVKILEEKDEVYVPGGYRGHHAIYKINKKVGARTGNTYYYRTEYNAGAYTEDAGEGLVWGVNKKKIKGTVAAIMRADSSNFFADNYKLLSTDLLDFTLPKASYKVAPQKIGNCTVRNTIEMLRDGFETNSRPGSVLFREFLYFVRNKKLNDLLEEGNFLLIQSLQDKKINSDDYKIGDYTRLMEAVLNEAKNIFNISKCKLNVTSCVLLESFIIQYLLNKKIFSLNEKNLLQSADIAIDLAKECIKRNLIQVEEDNLVLNDEFIHAEQFMQDYKVKIRDILNLIIKQLEYIFKIPFSSEELAKLERYVYEHILLEKYKAVPFMEYRNLLKFSYVVAEGMVETELVCIKDNEIRINDLTAFYKIKKNYQRIKQHYIALTRATNSELGKDLYLSIVANQSGEKLKFYQSLSAAEKIQCVLILKNILNHIFPDFKISRESVDFGGDFLLILVEEFHIADLALLEENIDKIKLNMEQRIMEYIRNKKFSQLEDHIKLSLLGRSYDKKLTTLTQFASQIIRKVESKISLTIQDKIQINIILKKTLKQENYSSLILIESENIMFDDAIVETILKKENREDLELMEDKLKNLIDKYNIEEKRLFGWYSFTTNSEKNLERLINEKRLSLKLIQKVLINAANNQAFEMVKTILINYNKIDINYLDDQGNNALSKAISPGNMDIVKLLLEHGALPDIVGCWGFTPLMWAYHCEKREVVALLEAKSDPKKYDEMFFKVVKGETYTPFKSCFSQKDQIKKFIEWKVDIETRDEYGNTALICAVWNGQQEAVEVLLEHKADVNNASSAGKTPLKNAYEKENIAIMKILIEAKASDSLNIFFQAVKDNKLEIVKFFLNETSLDVDTTDSLGNSLLSYAVSLDYPEIITALSTKTRSPAAPLLLYDSLLEPIYFRAIEAGDQKMVTKLLAKEPALLNKKNMYGQSALAIAYQHNKIGVMADLVEAKISDCANIFLQAIVEGKKDIVENFLNWGMDIETQDETKASALILAVKAKQTDIVRLLINRGANIGHQDELNNTPLAHAYKINHTEIMEVLVKAKCFDAEDLFVISKYHAKPTLTNLLLSWGVANCTPPLQAKGMRP